MSKTTPVVLIAGAGPVGMFAALALTKRGLKVTIVDPGLWTCSHSYALALHADSSKLLAQQGIDVHQVAYPVTRIGLYDSEGPKKQIDLGPDSVLAVLRQSALEDLMEKTLSDLGTKVSWRHEVVSAGSAPDFAQATIHEFEDEPGDGRSTDHEFTFVLGADGHHSQVRQSLGFEFPEIAQAQYYAVFEFKSDINLSNEMRVVLGERTTDILWPLPDGFWRWSFQLPDYADTEAEQFKDRMLAAGFGHFPTRRLKDRAPASVECGNPPAFDKEHLDGLIAERAPWFTGSVEELSWRTIVRFERRLSSSFGRGRIWLAGDSAHVTVPAGVQSMNLGLHEASELAGHFSKIASGEASLNALDQHNRRWTAVWRQIHGLESSWQPTAEADPWIRRNRDRLISCLPAHGDALSQLAGQLGLEVAAFEAVI